MDRRDGYDEQGIFAAAETGSRTIWQFARIWSDNLKGRAGGKRLERDAFDAECNVLVERSLDAERQLKQAHAELREALFQIRMEGQPLHPKSSGCMKCGAMRRLFQAKPDSYWLCAQCWFDCFGRWPEVPKDLTRQLIYNLYDMRIDDYIGSGVFSTVRRAWNIVTGRPVVVKTYSVDCNADGLLYTQIFFRGVDTLRILSQDDVSQTPGRCTSMELDLIMNLPTTSDLFVRLLDFSRDDIGSPGFYAMSCEYYMILEYGDYTLDSRLQHLIDDGKSFMLSDIVDIFHQMIQAIAMLHDRGFVHCDLKPLSFMYFSSSDRWKLLDVDGVVQTECTSPCNIFYTPLYCPPELAMQMVACRETVTISKRSDVWSLGVILIELVSLRPWLQTTLEQFHDLGIEDPGTEWLAMESKTTQLPPIVSELDPRLKMLCSNMLESNLELRSSLLDVMMHPIFSDSQILMGDLGTRVVPHNMSLTRASLVGRTTLVRLNVLINCNDVYGELDRYEFTARGEALEQGMQHAPLMPMDVNMDWSRLREQAHALQKRSGEFNVLLRQHQKNAIGEDAVVWAAAEKEASLLWDIA